MYRHGLGIRGQYCGWGLELPREKCPQQLQALLVPLLPVVQVQLQALLVPLVPVVQVHLPDSAGRGSRFVVCWDGCDSLIT
jgi:hypothetical protein